MSQPAPVPCPTCGAVIDGRFCGDCGEKRVTAGDYSVAHFVSHVFESLTNFDFKSLRALKTLVTRPGLLTRDYLDGRRRSYIGPVQLFVIVNIAFALAGSSTFRTPLTVQEHDPPFPAFKRSLVANAMTDRAVARDVFTRSFDDAAGLQAKTWVFAMIPLLGLVTAALYGFRRYAFEHLIFATHFLAFMLVWMLLSALLIAWGSPLFGIKLSRPDWDTVASALTLAGLAFYLIPGLRRVFGDSMWAASARTLAVMVLIYPVLLTYRFLLFFVTLLTMR